MPLGLLGKKLGMTQIFDESGSLVPVTAILVGPNFVLQKRDIEKDGYVAVQLGFDEKPERRANKPELGRARLADAPPCYFLREFRGDAADGLEVGQRLGVNDVFADGDKVDIIGTSKGRGFTSVRKRHNSRPGPKSHGSMYHNRPGSGGASSYPSRTFKGKPNPGRMGGTRVTAQNLLVIRRDADKNILFVRGSVPGATNGYVMVRKRTK
ncbi:MAG: 50S ribosomal protein L3 [Candidatus Sumerlaeia bacterium]|nr:50S ribosomal protein L3 [Candidatus Sumerlaeia bacterium]